MIRQAIASDDPVLFFEPKRRYWDKGEVDEELDDALAAGPGPRRRRGNDVTLVAYGPLVVTARDAALAARTTGSRSRSSTCARCRRSTSTRSRRRSARRGRLVITHEAQRSGGLGAEIAASITERCFYLLEAAPVRVTGFDVPYPAAKVEDHFLPDLDRILDGVDRVMGRPHSLTGWRAS